MPGNDTRRLKKNNPGCNCCPQEDQPTSAVCIYAIVPYFLWIEDFVIRRDGTASVDFASGSDIRNGIFCSGNSSIVLGPDGSRPGPNRAGQTVIISNVPASPGGEDINGTHTLVGGDLISYPNPNPDPCNLNCPGGVNPVGSGIWGQPFLQACPNPIFFFPGYCRVDWTTGPAGRGLWPDYFVITTPGSSCQGRCGDSQCTFTIPTCWGDLIVPRYHGGPGGVNNFGRVPYTVHRDDLPLVNLVPCCQDTNWCNQFCGGTGW